MVSSVNLGPVMRALCQGMPRGIRQRLDILAASQSPAALSNATGGCASHREICVLQTEDMFRDDDTARGDGPSSLLEGLVIERNLSGEQLTAALSKSGTSADEADRAQLTVNAPALLDRPVPARANPMARIHELGGRAAPPSPVQSCIDFCTPQPFSMAARSFPRVTRVPMNRGE